MTNIMQNPKFSTVLGLLIEASKRRPYVAINNQVSTNNHRVAFNNIKERDHEESSTDIIAKLSDSLKSVFKEIF